MAETHSSCIGSKDEVIDSNFPICLICSQRFFGSSHPFLKKLKPSNSCLICLGILLDYTNNEFLEKVKSQYQAVSYQVISFQCAISLPQCIAIREHSFWLYLVEHYGSLLCGRTEFDIQPVKAAWRQAAGTRLAHMLGIPHDLKSPFTININFVCDSNEIDCAKLASLDKERFAAVRARAGRRTRSEKYGRNTVQESLFESDPALFKRVFAWPTAFEAGVARVDSIAMQCESLFVGGRYRKLSRHLSQSPWLVDADADADADAEDTSLDVSARDDDCNGREEATTASPTISPTSSSASAPAASASASEAAATAAGGESQPQQHYSPHTLPTSIESLIGEPCVRASRAASFRFTASGREDIDVRMLGNGRPFAIECIDPHVSFLSSSVVKRLEEEINSQPDLITVSNLQVVKRTETIQLKTGEETKMKTYCALCFSSRPLSANDLRHLSSVKELRLEQWTPVRVLHRRSLACRERTIHALEALPPDACSHCPDAETDRLIAAFGAQSRLAHLFRLHLRTQAGTYVKEFVHGDLGRTRPNLNLLLSRLPAGPDSEQPPEKRLRHSPTGDGHSSASADVLQCDILKLDVIQVDLIWPPSFSFRS